MNKKKTILIILIILVLILVAYRLQDAILRKLYPIRYSEFVYKYAEEFDVDPIIIFSIIKAESNYERNSTSNCGAIGLMQLMPDTAKEVLEDLNNEFIIKEELYNDEKNIMIGTKYYSYLLKKYNNKELALAAYNAGIGNVDKWIKDGILNEDGSNIEKIPYKETNNYVRKILRNYSIYESLYNR